MNFFKNKAKKGLEVTKEAADKFQATAGGLLEGTKKGTSKAADVTKDSVDTAASTVKDTGAKVAEGAVTVVKGTTETLTKGVDAGKNVVKGAIPSKDTAAVPEVPVAQEAKPDAKGAVIASSVVETPTEALTKAGDSEGKMSDIVGKEDSETEETIVVAKLLSRPAKKTGEIKRTMVKKVVDTEKKDM